MADDNLAMWAGGQLVGGAIGAVGANLFTYGLSAAGISLPGASDLSNQLAAIQQTLNQIAGMLADVQNQLSEAEAQLLAAIQQSQFNTTADGLEQGIISDIVGLTERYNTHVASRVAGDETPDALAAERDDILSDIGRLLANKLSAIHNVVAGASGSGAKALYQIYADAIRGANRFLSYRHSAAVQARINYYQSMQYLQQVLVVTYYNAKGLPDEAARAIKTFQDNMVAENCFQAMPIPKGILIDKKSTLVLHVGPYVLTDAYTHAHGDMPLLGTMPGCPDVPDYDTRSPWIWRGACLGDLIGYSNAAQHTDQSGLDRYFTPAGIFEGYDSGEYGNITPAQWLSNNGSYQHHLGDYPDGAGSDRLWVSSTPWIQFGEGTWSGIFDISTAATPTWKVVYDGGEPPTASGGDTAYPLFVRRQCPGASWEIDDSLLRTNGDAGYRRSVLLKAADTGKYWSRVSVKGTSGTDDNLIFASKDTPDASCQFRIAYMANGTVALRADNDKFLSHLVLNGGDPIEATSDVADQSCQFGVSTFADGAIALIADNGKFLGNTNRGFEGTAGPSIEAAKAATYPPDKSYQIHLIGVVATDNPWQTLWPATDGTKYNIQVKGGMNTGAGTLLCPSGALGVALMKDNYPLWTFDQVAAGVYFITSVVGGVFGYLDSSLPGNRGVGMNAPDNSGRQRWTLTATGDGSFTITIGKPGDPDCNYLSTRADASVIDLFNRDDGSGRQRWLVYVSK